MVRPRYEFDDAQNATINGLSVRLKIIGVICFAVGITVVLMMFVRQGNLLALLVGGFSLTFGVLAIYAGQTFTRITTTQSRDIDHLMEALNTLNRVYNVQVAAIIAGAIGLGYYLWETLK
jgi:predicted lysophospholipase L1 biosynthesis ABC-type transport system permease subunit